MLQDTLKNLGFFPKSVGSNGNFGQTTLKAVQDFQVYYNIAKPGDVGYGRVGPNTRKKLNELINQQQNQGATSESNNNQNMANQPAAVSSTSSIRAFGQWVLSNIVWVIILILVIIVLSHIIWKPVKKKK